MRIVRAIANKVDYYPWLEWQNKFYWEDDEFQDDLRLKLEEKSIDKIELRISDGAM